MNPEALFQSIPVMYQVRDRVRIGTETSILTPELDNPTYRWSGSGLPGITKAALRGAFRDCFSSNPCLDGIPAEDVWLGSGGAAKGAVRRNAVLNPDDAELLLLPVRSFLGTFCWATCASALNRWLRSLGDDSEMDYPDIPAPDLAHVPAGSALPENNGIVALADGIYHTEVTSSANRISALLEKQAATLFVLNPASSLVVLHERVFQALTVDELLRLPGNRINEETGTVLYGPWFDEFIPEDAIFQGVVDIEREPILGASEQVGEPETVLADEVRRLDIGAHAGRGVGTLAVHIPGNTANNAPVDNPPPILLLRILNRMSITDAPNPLSNILDRPMFKDLTTGMPCVVESSLRGSLKQALQASEKLNDETLGDLFGTFQATGRLRMRDAQLLFFPLRSNSKIYLNLTTPHILRKLDAHSGILDVGEDMIPEPSGLATLLVSDAEFKETVPLGAIDLAPQYDPNLQRIAESLLRPFGLDESLHPLALVTEATLRNIIEYHAALITRIAIPKENADADDVRCWNEEAVPAESVFWTTETLLTGTSTEIAAAYKEACPRFLRLGAGDTSGSGYLELIRRKEPHNND